MIHVLRRRFYPLASAPDFSLRRFAVHDAKHYRYDERGDYGAIPVPASFHHRYIHGRDIFSAGRHRPARAIAIGVVGAEYVANHHRHLRAPTNLHSPRPPAVLAVDL